MLVNIWVYVGTVECNVPPLSQWRKMPIDPSFGPSPLLLLLQGFWWFLKQCLEMLRNRVWFNSVAVALASYENRVQPHTLNVLPPISFKKSATVEAGSVLNGYIFINLPDGPVLMLTIRFQPSTSFTAGYGCLQLRLNTIHHIGFTLRASVIHGACNPWELDHHTRRTVGRFLLWFLPHCVMSSLASLYSFGLYFAVVLGRLYSRNSKCWTMSRVISRAKYVSQCIWNL